MKFQCYTFLEHSKGGLFLASLPASYIVKTNNIEDKRGKAVGEEVNIVTLVYLSFPPIFINYKCNL